MEYKVQHYKESTTFNKEMEKLLNAGWTVERADAVGKLITYIFYKAKN